MADDVNLRAEAHPVAARVGEGVHARRQLSAGLSEEKLRRLQERACLCSGSRGRRRDPRSPSWTAVLRPSSCGLSYFIPGNRRIGSIPMAHLLGLCVKHCTITLWLIQREASQYPSPSRGKIQTGANPNHTRANGNT